MKKRSLRERLLQYLLRQHGWVAPKEILDILRTMQGVISGIDYKGQRFGRLLVVERRGRRGGSWLCKCDCGKLVTLPTSDFISGGQIACGCMSGKGNRKHGMHNTVFYGKWDSMKRRCENPSMHNYPLYGGRGIKCFWKSFEAFKEDMYETYLEHKKDYPNSSIERIDNEGNYCKENCRWATNSEQSKNRRSNVVISFRGEKKILTDWAREFGLPKTTLWGRLNRGMSMEDAIKL